MNKLFLLGCIFLILKLTGVITWSWWLVLLPFYLSAAINLIVITACIVILVLLRDKKMKHY